jgi:arylsulfatase A-like enzyme
MLILRVLIVSLLSMCHIALGAERPNILFIITDDQTYETLGEPKRMEVQTPNLDRLAARAMQFTQAYNMGSWGAAVCIASRTMLMTGRSLWRAEAWANLSAQGRNAVPLWPQLLQSAGYDTYFSGKWHVNVAAEKKFVFSRNVRPGMPKDSSEAYQRPVDGQPDPWNASDRALGGFWEGGRHWSEVTAEDAMEFIGMAKERAAPFFMYVAFNAPHDPRQSPSEYLERYPVEKVSLPASYLSEYPYATKIGNGIGLRDERLAPLPRSEHAIKVHRREYMAIMTHLDEQIGRVLKALDSSGLANRTWIIFTSDHGLAVGSHGLMGKQNMYEHSLRVPFRVMEPGAATGRKIDVPIYLQDAMPTVLELCGVKIPEGTDFHSLMNLISGRTEVHAHPAIYGAYMDKQRAIIEGGWKLIAYPEARALRLYHITNDPNELRDVASEPQHKMRKLGLLRKLADLQLQLADSLDLRSIWPE